MICEAILKDKQVVYLKYKRYLTRRNWTYAVMIVLLLCLALSIVTDNSLFMLLSVLISSWSLFRNRMSREFLDWVESFADGWATAEMRGKYVYVTSRGNSYIFIPVIALDAESDKVHVDFINRRVYVSEPTLEASKAGSTENVVKY